MFGCLWIHGVMSNAVGQSIPKVVEEERPSRRIIEQAKSIELAEIKLSNVSLWEAIDALKAMSVTNDSKRPYGERGVNIVLRESAHLRHPDPDTAAETYPLITYSASKVSVWQATEAVAALSGLHLSFNEYAIFLQSTPAPAMKITRRYVMPPGSELDVWAHRPSKPLTGAALAAAIAETNTPREAVYIARTRTLVVTANEQRHAEVLSIFHDEWRKYHAAQRNR